MTLQKLQIRHLRCLTQVDIEPSHGINLIHGPNGSGKTSILEAIFLLGRGRSFRAPRASGVIQSHESAATIYGELPPTASPHRLGLQVEAQKNTVHLDGEPQGTIADLAASLPVQLIDPEVHDLVQGGPGERRRFVDWGVFHVKHEFLPAWRRFRRALQQRNAALRQRINREQITAWDAEIVAAGQTVEQLRREYLRDLLPYFVENADKMQLKSANFAYLPGYSEGDLEAALAGSVERDMASGATQVGPHRAEIKLEIEGAAARHRLSRGQQKVLGAALVLAQAAHLAAAVQRKTILLVDEPAAELDASRLAQLLDAILGLGGQVFITALDRDALPLSEPAQSFRVEQGEVAGLI